MKKLFILFLIALSFQNLLAQNNCANAQPFCTGTTYTFPASTNVTAQTGPDYDCLSTQPNPAWYYLQISTAGSLVISIAGQQGGSSGQDVDFVCWGPYGSLTNICNNLTAANVVDCSYSSSSTETCTIQNAIPGQFYMLCVTNYANVNQNIVFSQTGGNGATNCNILCNITGMTATAGACVPGANTYSVSGNVTVFAPPSSGSLTISNTCGGPPVVLTPPFSTVIPYTMSNLPANGNNCSLTASFSADPTCTFAVNYVAPPPCLPCTITANNSGPYCVGQTINLTATTVNGTSGYTWTAPGFNATTQNPSIAAATLGMSGTYTVIASIPAGTCAATTSVSVNAAPTITLSTNSPICTGSNLQLNAGGGTFYQWSGPNGFNSSSQNPVISGVTAANAGVYNVTVTSSAGCSSTSNINTTIGTPPVINASVNSPVCVGDIVNFSSSGGAVYSWSGPNGFSTNAASPQIVATGNSGGNYTVTVSDLIGCSSSQVLPLSVNPPANPTISSNISGGCAPLCMNLNVANSVPVQTLTWDLGDGTSESTSTSLNKCYEATGVFNISVQVTDIYGCSGTANYTVHSYPNPVADFVFNPLRPTFNEYVTFNDASHNATIASYQWYFMNTPEHQSNVQNPTFMYTEAGTYVAALIVKSDLGCVDTLLKVINVGEDFGLYVPNSFTPNDDGTNDTFQPKGFGIVKYELQIFDRWGERIFHTNTFEQGWDGIRQKKNDVNYTVSKEDTYTWKINVTDVSGKHHEYTGHVVLIK
jgi:gliding motility-associated-like protein